VFELTLELRPLLSQKGSFLIPFPHPLGLPEKAGCRFAEISIKTYLTINISYLDILNEF
jgi:hypothetical protein